LVRHSILAVLLGFGLLNAGCRTDDDDRCAAAAAHIQACTGVAVSAPVQA
jgi:hypothetical protein